MRQQIIPPPGLTAEQTDARIGALLPIEKVREELASRTAAGSTTADNDLWFNAEANSLYFIEAELLPTSIHGNTVANEVRIIAPTGATGELTFIRTHVTGITGGDVVERVVASVNTQVSNRYVVDGANAQTQPHYRITGYVSISSTAGVIAIGWGVVSGQTGTVHANIGSFLRARKIS